MAALVHGEALHPVFAEHLAICVECARAFRAAQAFERTAGEQLAVLDHAVPQIPPRAVMVPLKLRHRGSLKRIAAGVTLLFAAFGAAAAVPASPLHRILLRAVAGLRSDRSADATVPDKVSPQRRRDTNSGVLFVPDSSLEIVFGQAQASGTIRVAFVNESMVSVKSSGGPRSFDLGRRRVFVNTATSSGSYDISIPATLKSVLIRIGTDTVLTRVGAEIRTVGTRDSHTSFTLPLSADDWKPMTPHSIR